MTNVALLFFLIDHLCGAVALFSLFGTASYWFRLGPHGLLNTCTCARRTHHENTQECTHAQLSAFVIVWSSDCVFQVALILAPCVSEQVKATPLKDCLQNMQRFRRVNLQREALIAGPLNPASTSMLFSLQLFKACCHTEVPLVTRRGAVGHTQRCRWPERK